MPKSVFTGAHGALVQALIEARKAAGVTQTELARRVGKDQSFISLIERSQRRVDTLEFYRWPARLAAAFFCLFASVAARLPVQIPI